MTDNHGYNTPPRGEPDWHLPLNDNFEQLDSDVEIRDTEANQANYTPHVNAKFLATDTERVFIGDGSNWISIPSTGRSPQFHAADVHDLNTVLNPDPSEGGDGIQAAADELGAFGGRIQLKHGEYRVDNPIDLPDGVELVGCGMEQSVLTATSILSDKMVKGSKNIRLADFQVDMADRGFAGVFLHVAKECVVERVKVLNAGARTSGNDGGLLLRSAFSNDARDNLIRGCVVKNSSNVSIDCAAGGSTPERTIVYGNRVEDQNTSGGWTHGISIENVHNATVFGNVVKGPSFTSSGTRGLAYNVNVATDSTVFGNTAINVERGLNIANGPAQGNVIANNTFRNVWDKGIRIQPSSDTGVWDNLIIGNVFRSVGGDNNPMGIQVTGGSHANIVNNYFLNVRDPIQIGSPVKPCHVTGNFIDAKCSGRPIVHHDDRGNTEIDSTNMRLNLANNVVERAINGQVIVGRPAEIRGNSFNNGHSTNDPISLRLESGGCVVRNNHLRGRVTGEDDNDIRFNNGDGGAKTGSYTGDGTTGRTISVSATPQKVLIQADSDGSIFDLHSGMSAGIVGSDPTGELSFAKYGFTVGDNGSDAHPNQDGVTYSYWVE